MYGNMVKKNLKTYRVKSSFHLLNGGYVVFISTYFLRFLSPKQQFRVVDESRGIIYETDKEAVMSRFNPQKLSKRVCMPICGMEFISLTDACQRRIDEISLSVPRRYEQTNIQMSLFPV